MVFSNKDQFLVLCDDYHKANSFFKA